MRRLVIQLAPSARRGALALLAGVVLSLPTAELHAASLYLCKAYSGGTFWSAEPCQGRQALVDRIVNVPDGLPFKEQVRLGEQARVQGEGLRQPEASSGKSAPASKRQGSRHTDQSDKKSADCVALAAKVNKLDAQARQAQSPKAQDRLTAQKHKLRERQADLHC